MRWSSVRLAYCSFYLSEIKLIALNMVHLKGEIAIIHNRCEFEFIKSTMVLSAKAVVNISISFHSHDIPL